MCRRDIFIRDRGLKINARSREETRLISRLVASPNREPIIDDNRYGNNLIIRVYVTVIINDIVEV